jgi:signal transduction histidine kinase
VAPVYGRDKLLGLIAADNQIIRKPIADFDVRLLQTFANHSAVAIERSRLYDGLREYTARLEEKNRLLAESQEQLVRIEKMSIIGELTSSIAHELRNPLTVIGGFANLILSSDKVRDYHEYLNVIVSEAKRAETVLHQVLDFSRAGETAVVDIEIGSLLMKTYELFVSQLKPAQNPPRTGFTHDKAFTRGNPTQLQHAFYQFMKITADEIVDEFRPIFKTEVDSDVYRFFIEFDIVPERREKILEILREIFGTAAGKQGLSLIVAGETIKYHRGHFGVAGGKMHPPRIYIELPLKEE